MHGCRCANENRNTLLDTAVHPAAAQSQWEGQIGLWRLFSCWGWRSTVISLMTLIMSPVSAHCWVNSHTHKCIALPYMLTSWDFIHAFIFSDCLSCTRVEEVLEPNPAIIGERSSLLHRVDRYTPTDNSESPTQLTCRLLNYERKPALQWTGDLSGVYPAFALR